MHNFEFEGTVEIEGEPHPATICFDYEEAEPRTWSYEGSNDVMDVSSVKIGEMEIISLLKPSAIENIGLSCYEHLDFLTEDCIA